MSHELAYFLKVNIALVLFYAFYRLFFYKDTFFKWRRTALLCFFMISILYPLMNIQDWVKEQEPMVAMVDIYSTVILPEITIDLSTEATQTDWKLLIISSLEYIYLGVIALLLIRFLTQFIGIIRLGLCSPSTILQNTKVHLLNKPQGPFSFFKWIFIYPDAHTGEELEEILTHERTHASQWHSVDVLFSELMCIFCWFNPFIWLMKREIRNNLEFMADHKVLETGHDCKTYQYHLLGLAHQKSVATLYNSFNVLPLKIRIRMMNKKRTKQIGRTKYLLFLPLAALLLIISNIEAIARSTEKWIDNVIQPEEINDVITADTIVPKYKPVEVKAQNNDVVFEVVEQMPEFPGGQAELMKFLSRNIKYPLEAQKSKTQGNVIVRFIISKEGNVTKPTIVRSISAELDAEAIRVIELMPKWKPGMQRGKAVNVKYTIPIVFRLHPSSEKIKVEGNDDNLITVVGYDRDYTPQEVSESDEDPIFEIVEQMPEYPGGNAALMNFLSQNIKYPATAVENKVQGRVIAQFVVSKEGNITNPKIVRSISPELDAEAIRIISLMPKWKPGKQRGQDVAVKYTVPINFNLGQGGATNQKTAIPKKIDDYGETQMYGETVYTLADNMPEFPGGNKALMDFIAKEMQYPAEAKNSNTQGRVIVQFVVDKDGNVKYQQIVRSVDPLLDQEAIRLMKSMPKWIPGKIKGEAVSTKYTVPVMFRLQ